ncbi:MAG: PaaI family thioesterase [Actinomycetota bacterium]
MTSESAVEIPAGFERHFKTSPFTDPWEPLYSVRLDDQVRIGTVITEAHCNSRGLVHGAFLAALIDNALGLSIGTVLETTGRDHAGLVTTNLSIDYVGRAGVGEWIATDCEVVKAGRTLSVASGVLATSERVIARANATFQVIQL